MWLFHHKQPQAGGQAWDKLGSAGEEMSLISQQIKQVTTRGTCADQNAAVTAF